MPSKLAVALNVALKAALPPFPSSGWGAGVSWSRFARHGIVDRDSSRSAAVTLGDGSGTSIVESCVNWIMGNFPEAPPALWRVRADETRERVKFHPLLELLARPNYDPRIGRSWYSGTQLIMATLASYTVDGNAYWLKERVRGPSGRVVRLWYVPHWMIEPKWPQDGSAYISHYDYRPGGATIELDPADVVHFRFGIDPENTRKGLSPLRAVLTDIGIDEESAQFTWALLRNGAVPGVIISPVEGDAGPGPDEAEALKLNFIRKFSRDRRGEPLVLEAPANVDTFGYSPEQMDLSKLRNASEERVTAALSVPAAVIGFGSGLHDANTNATYVELRLQAWENHLIPRGRLLATEIHDQLLTDFVSPAELAALEFGFDLSRVRALQDDENKKADRWKTLVEAEIATKAEARAAFDLEVTTADDVFLRRLAISAVAREEDVRDEPEPVVPAELDAGADPLALAAGVVGETVEDESTEKLRATLVELRSAVSELARETKSESSAGVGGRIDLADDTRKALLDSLGRPGLTREDLVVAIAEATSRATDALVKARESDRNVVTAIAARVESGQKAAAAALADAVRALDQRPATVVNMPAPRRVRVLYDGDRVIGAEPIEEAV